MDAFLVVSQVIVRGNQHIVHVDDEPSFVNFVLEDGVHHHLKGGWGICQPEEHDRWFKQSFIGDKGCFPLVSPSNADVVVSPSNVEFSEQSPGTGFVYELGN